MPFDIELSSRAFLEEAFNMTNIDNDFYFQSRQKPFFTENQVKEIHEYLENPVKKGYWFCKGEIVKNKGIFESILNDATKNSSTSDMHTPSETFEIEKNIHREIARITFVFYLFATCCDEKYPKKSSSEYVCEKINKSDIIEKYSEGFEFFKSNIYNDNFYHIFGIDQIFHLKNGQVILYVDDNEYNFISLHRQTLEDLVHFLELLGIYVKEGIKPIYSPEEKVFVPYFIYLDAAYQYFIDETNIKRLIQNSIQEYEQKNYSHCISTVGLIAEAYLTQIYEIYFRDFCPRKLTLGQLYDAINSEIKREFPPKTKVTKDPEDIFNKIDNLMESNPSNKETLEVARLILNYIREDRKNLLDKITKSNNKNEKITVFPQKIRDNLFELIKNRNAISHNSRIPIGDYEALKTVYCCITLITWWQREQDLINWEDNPKKILEDAIIRNK